MQDYESLSSADKMALRLIFEKILYNRPLTQFAQSSQTEKIRHIADVLHDLDICLYYTDMGRWFDLYKFEQKHLETLKDFASKHFVLDYSIPI